MLFKIVRFLFACYVAFTFFVCLFVSLPIFLLVSAVAPRHGALFIHRYLCTWAKVWLAVIGMKPTVIGGVPAGERAVIVANHNSYLDTIIIFAVIASRFQPLGKVEMTKVPLFGAIYKRVVIPVDRGSDRSRAKSMKMMMQALKHTGSIMLFPEGGFNESEEPLKPFFDGAFRLAIAAGVPIVPLLLPDTLDRWHYSKWYKMWPGRNRAVFLPPIYPNRHTVTTIKEEAFKAMEHAIVVLRTNKKA